MAYQQPTKPGQSELKPAKQKRKFEMQIDKEKKKPLIRCKEKEKRILFKAENIRTQRTHAIRNQSQPLYGFGSSPPRERKEKLKRINACIQWSGRENLCT